MYLLDGSSLFPRRLSLLRATGSKSLASSDDGGGTEKEDESSSCCTAEVDALRRVDGWTACIVLLASLHRAEAVRNGSSRSAMVVSDGRRCGSGLALMAVQIFPSRGAANAAGNAGILRCDATLGSPKTQPRRAPHPLPRRRLTQHRTGPAQGLGGRLNWPPVPPALLTPPPFARRHTRASRGDGFFSCPIHQPRPHPAGAPHCLVPPARPSPRHPCPHCPSTPPGWTAALAATMNGMSRFLSRREKHHEKRSSKNLRNKVRPPSPSSSSHSSEHLLCSVDGSSSQTCSCHHRRRQACFQYLHQALPSAWSSLVHSGSPFLCSRPPAAKLSQVYLHVSTVNSSDHLTLQSHQPPTKVPSELYRVFTNEDQKAADKDGEKKVRPAASRNMRGELNMYRSRCWSRGYRALASPP